RFEPGNRAAGLIARPGVVQAVVVVPVVEGRARGARAGREILAQNLLEIGFGDGDALLQHQGIGAGGGIAVPHDLHAGETDADHERGHDELDEGDPALAGAASRGHHTRSTKPVAAYTRKERVMIVAVTSLLAPPSGVNAM